MYKPEESLQKQYSTMAAIRDPHLRRARKCSEVTLPFVIPPEGHTQTEHLPTPYQSVGARGVSNLSAKLLLALMPPSHPFFRLPLPNKIREELGQQQPDALAEVDKSLKDIEMRVMATLEKSNTRSALYETLKLLILSGNALLHLPDERTGIRVYKLTDYVVKRDPRGSVIKIITHEKVHPASLREDVAEATGVDMMSDKMVSLYTCIRLEDGKYKQHQEINDKLIPDSEGTYPKDLTPWMALRWQRVDGEDYGRGLCEELLGDLISLEGLTKSMVLASAAASKTVFMMEPGSVTLAADLAKAESGDFVTGSRADVSVLQVEKYNDLRIAAEVSQRLEARLSQAFMLAETVQRNAERVTAEEIRFMASELDESLGGVYSVLAQELQLPLVKRIMSKMQQGKELPDLPKEFTEPVVVTGLDALGRTSDLQKLDQLVQAVFGLDPQLADRYINIREYIQRRANALAIDSTGIIKTDEEIMQAEQQAQMMQAMQALGPQAVTQAGQMMQGAMQADPAAP